MDLQRADKITELELELYIEDEVHPWILRRLEKTLTKRGSPDVSTTMYMNIWQKIIES